MRSWREQIRSSRSRGRHGPRDRVRSTAASITSSRGADFEERIAAGDVLEWAQYGGNLYGTLRAEVLPVLATGSNILLDIENEGGKQIRASFPDAVLIFIRPPTIEELERRLTNRGDTDERDVEQRLAVAEHQMVEALTVYDHIIVNDDLEVATAHVLDILTRLASDER